MSEVEALKGQLAALSQRLAVLEAGLQGVMITTRVSVALAADYQALRGLCEHCGISVEDAQSGCREQRIVERRHLVMRRLHAEYGWEVPRIARALLCGEKAVRDVLKSQSRVIDEEEE